MKKNLQLANKFQTNIDCDIVYDAEKVKQHKEELDKKVTDFEAWEAKEHKKRIVYFILYMLCFFATVAFCVSKFEFDFIKTTLLLAFPFAIPAALYETAWNFTREALEPNRKYTPDIEYYLATEGKHILNIKVEPESKYFPSLTLDIESDDHSITNKGEN